MMPFICKILWYDANEAMVNNNVSKDDPILENIIL